MFSTHRSERRAGRRVLVLFLILAGLAGVIFLLSRPDEAPSPERHLLDFGEAGLTSFQVNHFTLGILFKQDGDTWLVKRVKNELAANIQEKDGASPTQEDTDFVTANAAEVAKALIHLMAITVTEPIATSAKLSDFRINPFSLHVVFFGPHNKELARLRIGRQGPDLFSTFVTLGDSTDVYLVEENLFNLMMREFEEWLPEDSRVANKDEKKPLDAKVGASKSKRQAPVKKKGK